MAADAQEARIERLEVRYACFSPWRIDARALAAARRSPLTAHRSPLITARRSLARRSLTLTG